MTGFDDDDLVGVFGAHAIMIFSKSRSVILENLIWQKCKIEETVLPYE
jgi:hypothetical protein